MEFRHLLGGALVASLLLAGGCGMFDNGDKREDTSPIPGALNDPSGADSRFAGKKSGFGSGGHTAGLDEIDPNAGGISDWNKGADPASLAGTKGDLVPASPTDNLNYPIIYFALDTDVLVATETSKLDKAAAHLKANKDLYLIIEGHCDQRGTEEYNRALGERRANAVRAYLNGVGLADGRIRTLSFGKDKPAVSGSGESVWGQNRRAVLVPAVPAH